MMTQNDGLGPPDGRGGTDRADVELDDLFVAAQAVPCQPSDALMARVLADAMAEQPRADRSVAMAAAPGPRQRGPGRKLLGVWQRLVWALGGAGALAGMGTAAVAGLYIGFAQPAGLDHLDEAMLGVPLETVELLPGIDALLLEGD